MARFKQDEIEIESDLSQDPSTRDELYELAKTYGKADAEEKDAKKAKERTKGPMLELMTAVVREEIPLARETVIVTDDDAVLFEWDWRKWCERHYPEWRVVNIEPAEGQTSITIEENEALKKFEFVVDGKKYGRIVAMVESEFFAEEFYKTISEDEEAIVIESDEAAEAALRCINVNTITTYTLDEEAAEAAIADYPELVPVFQRFSTLGKPQVRLIPIKVVKEEV